MSWLCASPRANSQRLQRGLSSNHGRLNTTLIHHSVVSTGLPQSLFPELSQSAPASSSRPMQPLHVPAPLYDRQPGSPSALICWLMAVMRTRGVRLLPFRLAAVPVCPKSSRAETVIDCFPTPQLWSALSSRASTMMMMDFLRVQPELTRQTCPHLAS